MQGNIALKAMCAASGTGFSLDELVVKVAEVMEQEGLSEWSLSSWNWFRSP